jgi:hypothetical protein
VIAQVIVQVRPFVPGQIQKDRSPHVGDAAPDFTLKDLDGRPFRLRDVVGRRPLVLEFVCIT